MSHAHGMHNMTTTMAMVMSGNNTMGNHHHHHHSNMSMTTQDPHSGMDHGDMDHGGMDHGGTDHGDMDHGGMDHSNHSGSGHGMKMYFHTGLTEYILFENLFTTDVGGLVGACFAIFALSVVYEGLKYIREFLLKRGSASAKHQNYAPSTSNGDVINKQPEVGARMLSGSHVVQTVLHMVQVFVSYCLMLVFMTYNVYLCISIILGAGVGYFLFGWRRAMVVDMNEHCH